MVRALAMVSGGLDSILASKLIKDQGIEVIGICFKSYFFTPDNAIKMCKQIDIPLEIVDFSKEHFEMVKNPKHGYGKNMNPCIDCHSMMMKYAGELLEKFNGDFIITGEVLNQRPMSQNKRSLDIVKNESGFSNKILRPLCAKNLEPTDMENNGLVNRENLLDISGRSRTVQMELADKWGIVDYPSPAGGCRLTEPNYSIRLKDLVKNKSEIKEKDISLLRYGRHFRLGDNCKIVAARTEEESKSLKSLLTKDDMIFFPNKFSGAMIAIVGEASEEDIEFAAKLSGRYSKGKNENKLDIKYGRFGRPMDKIIEVSPIKEDEMQKYMINC
ncbi:tRNA 4-thiouridine(8) synthase ThiI [Clostridium sp.]|uniref:tRNA 4-thiouridine(8) synthase ThiI n=1 Tax=Clostridium sp. TaxID=1506 RepID=UPI0034638982